MAAWLTEIANRRTMAHSIAAARACEFLTFYLLPEVIPFVVRLTMVVVMPVVVGPACNGRNDLMSSGTTTTGPWRNLGGATTCPRPCSGPPCGAEPGWRCTVSTGGASRRNVHTARVRSASATGSTP